MYARFLTDSAGGNIAVRVGSNHLLITPSMMSRDKHHHIVAEDVLLTDMTGAVIEGEGCVSREITMHLGIHRAIPGEIATIHAHPRYCLVFAAAARPIPVVLDCLAAAGPAEVIPYAPVLTHLG